MTFEDHRQLAERCVRLAKECSQPKVAAYLMTLAASYVEMAELAVGARQPGAVKQREIKLIKTDEGSPQSEARRTSSSYHL